MSGRLGARHVVVAGGGLAGLAAALSCADAGIRVTLLERRARLGGLTYSFNHNGVELDNGQHVFLACCDAYQAFLDRIGSGRDVEAPAALDIPVLAPAPAHGVRSGRLRRRELPVPLHLAGALMRYPLIGLRDRAALGRALAGLHRLDLDDPALDRRTFGSWLADHGQSPAAVESVWDLITVPTVNLPAAEASLSVAAMVFKTGLLSSRSAADIGWSRVPLGRLHGARAADALRQSGAAIRTGVRVLRVRPPHEPAARWTVETDHGPVEADGVVCALPHEDASSVLPAGCSPAQDRWSGLGSSAIVNVHLFFDRPVMRWPFMTAVRSPVQWVFDRTTSSGWDAATDGRGQYLAVSLSAADHLLGTRPEDLVSSTVEALSVLLPEVRGAGLADSLVTKERRATFRAVPGTASARPQARTALAGLTLAGAWTSTGWPATMEGAVRSGRTAADTLLRQLAGSGLPQSSHPPHENQEVA
jgi:squalene-associated FAD-dependent desaturase